MAIIREWTIKVDSMNFYYHGYNGPEVTLGSSNFWNNTDVLNWSVDAYAAFYGCETSAFAENFAGEQGVTSYGQAGKSSFSINPLFHLFSALLFLVVIILLPKSTSKIL